MNFQNWRKKATLQDALACGLTEDEYNSITEIVGKDLNIVEIGIFAALYSEHCSYKSTKLHLKHLLTKGPNVVVGPGENAGVVDIGDNICVAFKVESHNHPTFIEPYQGAATGVGGILRDVFTMGARPVALLNALRFGDPKLPKTAYLFSNAVAGIGDYGNCVGIPTVGGELFFDPSYNGNCLVNAFALGIVEKDKIFLGKASGVGNSVIYVGSKTGRDGIHGATMASEEFSEDAASKKPTVQVGDPFQEKLLLEACLEAMQTGAIVGIQDMGAAGLTSSSYEMAARAGTGLKLDLDKIPQREEDMNPYEIMLSESQERMLIVAEKGREDEIKSIFDKWGLDSVKVGEVIEGQDVELYWHGELISKLNAPLLVDSAPVYRWPEQEPPSKALKANFDIGAIPEPSNLTKTWEDLIASPNLCSRHPVYRQYDSTVRTNTVIHPGGDAGVIRIKSEKKPEKGVAMTIDCNSRYCSIDPRLGAALTVLEAFRNITSVGAKPLAISDCLNFGSPEKPEGMWEIAEAIRGIDEASRALTIPIVSGNVSLYNETEGKAIMPTPMIAMVGVVEDCSLALQASFKKEGDAVFVIGATYDELGGSEYMASLHGISKGKLPNINYELERKTAELILELANNRLLQSCHDISSGGMAVGLVECCVNEYSSIGVSLSVENKPKAINGLDPKRKDILLFSESGARYIISCIPQHADTIRSIASEHGIPISLAGTVGGDTISIEGYAHIELAAASKRWLHGLKEII
ncbi:MAG: phosphoribosylformylglycinamidine synthase subunit PurL [Candidatus Dadabacteria bacterium]|nr:MAG: phosphoribosylformylglycinamidine synthase subunit PurL [Candidatus Dadabacteria bacterium]